MSRRQKRQRFIHWLRTCFSSTAADQMSTLDVNRPVQLERLEGRNLMAVDSFLPLLGSAQGGNDQQPIVSTSSTNGLVAEGEAAPDLVAFAKAIRDSGTLFFGAYWCPHCLAQKQLFQDGAQFLPYEEMTNASRQPNSRAIAEGVTQYPTWQFPDGSRLTGQQSLQTLATKANIAIPQASKPSFAPIANTNVESGAPMHIPVDAYDPNGNPLTVTVTSSNPSAVSAEVLTGNRSMRVRVKDFGDMVFQLFEGEAPIPTSRIIELANSGFYNNRIFHRVVNNFVIQAGNTAGLNPNGNSQLGNIADQFNVNLQHNRTGVLSYAKTPGDDTGDAQFFVTEGANSSRHLDFNHPVFGQLIEGEAVRDAISNVAVNQEGLPTIDIVIESVTIFNDAENGLIRLKANATSGTSTITVTVADNEGNTTSQTFVATATPDAANGAPFLNPIPTVTTTVNTPATITLSSQDVENSPVTYAVEKVGSQNYQVTVNATTGVVSFTPPTGFSGTLQFRAKVQQTSTPTTLDPTDTQLVTVVVNGTTAPTGVDLDTASDLGASNSDNRTNASAPTFTVSGTTVGAIVKLKVGNTVIGQATATGATTVVTANNLSSVGQGAVLIVATQTSNNSESAASPSLSVTLDTVAPVTVSTAGLPGSAQINQAVTVNLTHAEEGQGLVYSLENAPTGMTIDSGTGAIAWTPTQAQLGTRAFNLKLTDLAGNVTTQALSVNVIEQPLAKIIVQTVDLQGNPITQVAAGQQFKVRVLAQDVRGFSAKGVFSAYIDLLFDPNVVEPIANNAITHTAPYTNGVSPTASTPAVVGAINELGGFSGNLNGTDGEPRLFAEVTFVAKAAGNPNIRSEAADVSGNEILMYDETEEIPDSKIDYGTATLAVGANFQVVNDAFNFDEDSGVRSLNVLANDTVTGGAVLTITSVGASNGSGTVTIAADGKTLNYTPGANFNGAESFTYTARNQDNVSLTGTVTIQVADVNDQPIATNDVFEIVGNSSSNVLNVLLNDSTGNDAPASETLRVTAVGTPSNGGTVTMGSSGLNLLYTPKPGFIGTETVTYTLGDGRGGTATGTVSITVKIPNPPPVAVADTFTVVEDAVEASFNVTSNDTTDAGETLTISAVSASTKGSTLKISADAKQVLYKPGPNFAGQEVLTYTLRDSGGATATGTITFNVTAVNDAPDAIADTLNILSSSGVQTLNVLANDLTQDADETLTITAITQPGTGKGTIAISSDGKSLRYTPPSADFSGTVSFSYTISDGSALTDGAGVTLNVQNYVPRAIGGNLVHNGSATNLPYGGVDVVLSGTDLAGTPMSFQLSTDTTGKFTKEGLAPGTYTISRPALPFLEDNGDSITVTSAVADTSNTSLKSSIGGLKSGFISIRNFLGSASGNGLTVAVKPGTNESWFSIKSGFNGYSNIRAQLNAAATSLTVSAVNPSNQNVSTTLPLAGANSRVTVLGTEDGAKLLRIGGSADQLGFKTSSASSASGEGEGLSSTSSPASSSARSRTSGLVAEGEAAPVVESSAATLATLSTSQVLRRFLGSNQQMVIPTGNSLVSATTQLPPGAVDSALGDIDALSLGSGVADALLETEIGSDSQTDSALLSL